VPRVSIRLALGDLVRVGATDVAPLSAIAGADVHALLAIADPASFVRQMEMAGARVVATIFPDHHEFEAEEVAQFVAGISPHAWAVCTLKDAVKVQTRWPRQAPPLWYVSQLVSVERGVGGVERVLDDVVRTRFRPAQPPTVG